MNRFILSLTVLIGLTARPATACTAFDFGVGENGGVAHNFDWFDGMPYTTAFFINARNVTKDGLNVVDSRPVPHWTSKYGSVTYSLLGRDFPVGGQNEKGLVIHIQQNIKSQYPEGSLPTLEAGQFAQLLLDMAATVPEALAMAATVQPYSGLDLHYFLCDANGVCGVIEFLNGQMETYSGTSLPVHALTNTDYPSSLSAWHACQKNSRACTFSDNSLQRFVEAAKYSSNLSTTQSPLDYALSTLEAVAQSKGSFTRFHFFSPRAVADKLYFMTPDQSGWQSIDMSKVDYSCASDGSWFEITSTAKGDQTAQFRPYTVNEQKKLVAQLSLPANWVAKFVGYPATTVCK